MKKISFCHTSTSLKILVQTNFIPCHKTSSFHLAVICKIHDFDITKYREFRNDR